MPYNEYGTPEDNERWESIFSGNTASQNYSTTPGMAPVQLTLEATREPVTEIEQLEALDYTREEITNLLQLRESYQSGVAPYNSDRVFVMRYWEYLRLMVASGRIEA